MSKLLEGDSEPSRLDLGELRTTLATFLRMSQALAIDGGRSMCAAQVGCRHLWLGLSSLKDQEKKQLLNLPLSTASLFGPDFLSFVDRLDSATKASAQLAPHLRPQLPQRTPHRQDKRRRSRSPPRRAAAARSAPRIPAAPEPRRGRDKSARPDRRASSGARRGRGGAFHANKGRATARYITEEPTSLHASRNALVASSDLSNYAGARLEASSTTALTHSSHATAQLSKSQKGSKLTTTSPSLPALSHEADVVEDSSTTAAAVGAGLPAAQTSRNALVATSDFYLHTGPRFEADSTTHSSHAAAQLNAFPAPRSAPRKRIHLAQNRVGRALVRSHSQSHTCTRSGASTHISSSTFPKLPHAAPGARRGLVQAREDRASTHIPAQSYALAGGVSTVINPSPPRITAAVRGRTRAPLPPSSVRSVGNSCKRPASVRTSSTGASLTASQRDARLSLHSSEEPYRAKKRRLGGCDAMTGSRSYPARPFRAGPPTHGHSGRARSSSSQLRSPTSHGLLPSLGVLVTRMRDAAETRALLEEVSSLLLRGAVVEVQAERAGNGFYSPYFLVPKKSGGVRPILDLRILNGCIAKRPFRMLTTRHLLECVSQGDWMTSVDLTDAYFHVSIVPEHRKFLRFSVAGKCYEYCRLPFGYSLAPRTFSKCVEAALDPLRRMGIRILTYIDDWLILASSRQEAQAHTKVVLDHISKLGFVVNRAKSSLRPAQVMCYLGLQLDSLNARASLSAGRRGPPSCSAGPSAYETPPAVVLPSQIAPSARQEEMAEAPNARTEGYSVLDRPNPSEPGRAAGMCPPLHGGVHRCLPDWLGGVLGQCSTGGTWSPTPRHINVLEMEAVKNVLLHFRAELEGHHVLVRSDNTTVVAYLNRQGGTRSPPLHRRAAEILLWANTHLLSLRARHIPGVLNVGADRMSRGGAARDEWSLAPWVAAQGTSLLWASTRWRTDVGRGDSFMPSPPPASASAASQSQERQTTNPGCGPGQSECQVVPRLGVHGAGDTLAPPGLAPDADSGPGSPLLAPNPRPQTLGLEAERGRLLDLGLPSAVVSTIQGARAPSTVRAYRLRWQLFATWCAERSVDPLSCPIQEVLGFLQSLLAKGRSASTLGVFASAIASGHTGFGGFSARNHPLVKRFLRGALRLNPPLRRSAAAWDLQVVLEGLSGPPFEPLDRAELSCLSFKTVLLLALASAKRAGELCALSIHPSCLSFSSDGGLVELWPNQAFQPKVITSSFRSRVIRLRPLCPPPHASAEEERSHLSCPVRALRRYLHCTAGFRRSDQLFVGFGAKDRGAALSSQRLAHWVCQAIHMAYEARGRPPPALIRAHSTRGVATSTAMLRGVSLEEICLAASWSSSSTFVQSYLLDVTAQSVAHSVLSRGPHEST
ncbi:hypothetical protein WMY93_014456 [Mugilogobius chulae]|uniref:ribonuclease H n=1 Tax=Mugilogobius chulae TaxID=88201 RepID=A0AAW0P1K2_9GOBI